MELRLKDGTAFDIQGFTPGQRIIMILPTMAEVQAAWAAMANGMEIKA